MLVRPAGAGSSPRGPGKSHKNSMRRALWSLLAAAIIAQVACLSQKNCTVKINSLSSGTNISTASMSNPDDCAKACEASERCCVAEFNKDLKQCYLKTGGEATGWHQDVCAITCVPACILPPTPPPTPPEGPPSRPSSRSSDGFGRAPKGELACKEPMLPAADAATPHSASRRRPPRSSRAPSQTAPAHVFCHFSRFWRQTFVGLR